MIEATCNMNKRHVSQLIESLKGIMQDKSDNVINAVNNVLLPVPPTKGVAVTSIGEAPILDKSSICPMALFLKDFEDAVGTFDSSQIGIAFAVIYLEALQDFARKTNADASVVSEINELLETLNK